MGIFFTWILLSVFVGMFGSDRKIGFWGSFGLSLLLSPVIGLIFTLMSDSNNKVEVEKQILNNSNQQTQALNTLAQKSYIDELHKLKDLLDSNLITREEFDREKEILDKNREQL